MKWRVMIVDDEEDVRTILRATLGEEFEVFEAKDGLDALEKLERYEPDFVCMDVMMPLMNGFDACTAIRKSPRFSNLPVMFLTALGSKDDIRKGYGAGANLYLTKPFEPERLLKNIAMHFTGQGASPHAKKYTIEQLHEFEAKGVQPVAPGATEFILPELNLDDDPPPPPPSSQVPRQAPPSLSSQAVARPGSSSGSMQRPITSSSTNIPANIKPRVMVVDDDPDIIAVMKAALAGTAEVVTAGDGMQAIERLVRYQPDVVIIDIMLPKMSGFQLCQSLRGNRAFSSLPIMICSAKCSDKDRQFAQRSGANDFLPKPFTVDQLLGKLEGFASQPDFRIIWPKTIPYEEILAAEAPPEPSNVFIDGEGDELKDRLKHLASKGVEKAKPAAAAPEPEKKRSWFGFGRK